MSGLFVFRGSTQKFLDSEGAYGLALDGVLQGGVEHGEERGARVLLVGGLGKGYNYTVAADDGERRHERRLERDAGVEQGEADGVDGGDQDGQRRREAAGGDRERDELHDDVDGGAGVDCL